MDLRLPLLADANLHLGVAEEALAEGEAHTARTQLEKAEEALAELREIWPELEKSEQGLLTALAAPLAERAGRLEASLGGQSGIFRQTEAR